jgi:hypothetical protein
MLARTIGRGVSPAVIRLWTWRQWSGETSHRIDAARLDGVDELEHALNLRPAIDMQQDLCAGRDCRTVWHAAPRSTVRRMSSRDRTCHARSPPSARARRRCRREEKDAAAAIELSAEADPVLRLLLDPDEFDQ